MGSVSPRVFDVMVWTVIVHSIPGCVKSEDFLIVNQNSEIIVNANSLFVEHHASECFAHM